MTKDAALSILNQVIDCAALTRENWRAVDAALAYLRGLQETTKEEKPKG